MSRRTDDRGTRDRNGIGHHRAADDEARKTSAETQLNSILSIVPDAIITIDEEGTIASFSRAAELLFGYEAIEVIGRNVKMLMPAPYHEEHDGYLAHYRATGEKKIIGIGREVEAQRKDGSIFPLSLAVNEMLIDGRRMFIGVVHDISKLRNVQSKNIQFGDILESSLNEIFIFDVETLHFIQVNRGARENIGYSADEFRELTPVDIKPEMTAEQFAKLIAPLRDGVEKVLVFKTVHQRKDGSTYPVEVHLQLQANVTPQVFVAIIQDISEIERRDELLRHSQKMEAIGQLTGGIAHDFNNILTVISGNLEFLELQLKDPDQRDLLKEAMEATEMGAALTDRLLTFARRRHLEPETLNLNDVVLRLTDLLKRTLGGQIDLSTVVSPNLWSTRVDPGQVENALMNLVINARDAMPDGGRVIVETKNAMLDGDYAQIDPNLEPGHYVLLTVTDTGEGISHEVSARVFEPFFTTKEVGKGTGLGLSMVYGFAKQSQGHVTLYSEEGLGTTINIYLPAMDVHDSERRDDRKQVAVVRGVGEKILVVEDDPKVRPLTVRRVQSLGYVVREAENANSALDILDQDTEIDLVFTDIVMPGGNSGYELAEEIRKTRPNVKVLLTSGYAEELVHPDALATYNLKVLRKPYPRAALAEALFKALHE